MPLFSASSTAAPTRRLLARTATIAGEEMTVKAAQNTPVRTGSLASKWRPIPTHEVETHDGERGFTSGATNPSHIARWVEYGTEPHQLKPRRKKAIETPEGPRAHAEHPGTEGQHPLARAAAEVEAVWDQLTQPALTTWAEEIEAAAKRHEGIS